MRAVRLLRLLHLLAVGGRRSAAELARALDVSPRTIYRDVGTLSSAGFPVYAEHGPDGGYELLEDFRSPFVVLTPEEVGLLVRLGRPPAAADLGIVDDVARAYDKLTLALTRTSKGRHRPLVHVDAPRWFDDRPVPRHLTTLADALAEGRLVEVRGRRGTSTVRPLGLVDKAGRWYLVADEPSHGTAPFATRVDRLDSVVTGVRHPGPDVFDLAGFWERWVERFEGSRPEIDVLVEIGSIGAEQLPRALGDRLVPIIDAAPADPDGRRRITIRFRSVDAAVHHLTGAGHLARVVEPNDIADLVRARAAAVLAAAR